MVSGSETDGPYLSVMGKNISKDVMTFNDSRRIAALRKHLSTSKDAIPAAGVMYTPAEMLAFFQTSLDQRNAVAVAHAAYKSALAARDRRESTHRATDEALRGWVLNRFGIDSVEANEFGYSARKLPQMSIEARANAVLLNKATREARGTMGKRERLKIKGTLDAPSAPSASSADHAADALHGSHANGPAT